MFKKIISFFKDKCWHHWVYIKKIRLYDIYARASWDVSSSHTRYMPWWVTPTERRPYHRRACSKCGKCEDNITHKLESVRNKIYKQHEEAEQLEIKKFKEGELAQKLWDTCMERSTNV